MKSNVKGFLIKKIQERGVLSQGDFCLNSGEHSNYYYNFGKFNDSQALTDLGFVFWTTLKQLDCKPDIVFGCAMKGISLAIATSMYAFTFEETIFPFAYDRKEIKNHGEGGDYVGADIRGKSVLIIDDVLTTGRALHRTINVVKQYTDHIQLMVMLSRDPSITHVDNYPVFSIIDHNDVVDMMK